MTFGKKAIFPNIKHIIIIYHSTLLYMTLINIIYFIFYINIKIILGKLCMHSIYNAYLYAIQQKKGTITQVELCVGWLYTVQVRKTK